MKTIAALTMFGVLALASAGTSGARGELGPAPGQPDPARVVLRSTDLGGARVRSQGYYHEQGFVSSYSRTFSAARAGSTLLVLIESDAGVAPSSSDARDAVGGFRRFAASAAGRAALTKTFQSIDSSGLVVSHVRVGAVRPISGGWDVSVQFQLLRLPTQAHVAMFSSGRVLGQLLMIGAPGRTVPLTTVSALAGIMNRRATPPKPPKNVTLPSISGTPAVGQALTASPGTWANGPGAFRYQWIRCDAQSICTDIQGATASRYVPAAADAGSMIQVRVSTANAGGTAVAVSTAVGPVAAPPAAVELPVITGQAVVDGWLTATTGTWSGAPASYSFAWMACDATGTNCNTISGSAQSFRLSPGDVGLRFIVVVTATNAAGSTTVASLPTAVVVSAS